MTTDRDRKRDLCRRDVYYARKAEQDAIEKARWGNWFLACQSAQRSELAWVLALESFVLWLRSE